MPQSICTPFSTKAPPDENLVERVDSQLDVADRVAGFGRIGDTNKAMAKAPRQYVVAFSRTADRVVLREIDTTMRHSMLSRPWCSRAPFAQTSRKYSPGESVTAAMAQAKAFTATSSANHSSKAPLFGVGDANVCSRRQTFSARE
jgi:hypothetical protein